MYTIIGGDGREYGPVPKDQVRTWIAGGRANFDTRAKVLGTDEWTRLGDLPEFAVGDRAADGPEEAAAAPEAPLADRLLRLGAFLADVVLAMLFLLPGALMIGTESLRHLLQAEMNGASVTPPAGPGVNVIALAMFALFLLQTWLLTTRGQTVGKWLLRIRIVRFRDGAPPGFVHAVLLRSWTPAFLSLIPLVGPYFPFFDIGFIFGPNRRCLHDLIADTKVVTA